METELYTILEELKNLEGELTALSEKRNKEVVAREVEFLKVSDITQRSAPTPVSLRSETPGSTSLLELRDVDMVSVDDDSLEAPKSSKRRRA
jgi:hypothetical protein